MDFNYLYQRQGVERLRAAAAACRPSRAAHLGLAEGYARLIEAKRADPDEAREPLDEPDGPLDD